MVQNDLQNEDFTYNEDNYEENYEEIGYEEYKIPDKIMVE